MGRPDDGEPASNATVGAGRVITAATTQGRRLLRENASPKAPDGAPARRASDAPVTADGARSSPPAATRPAAFANTDAAPGDGDARTVGPTAAAAAETWHAARTAAAGIAGVAARPTPGAAAAAAATAVAAFADFAAAVPALADQAALGRGEALADAGDGAGAAAAYASAAALAGDPATAVVAHIRVGNARLTEGDAAAALTAYDAALAVAADDGSRAQAMAGLVAAHLDRGDAVAAGAVRLRLVRELPGTPPAAVALERLREAGVAVTALEEAAVYRAQGDPARAVAVLDAAADPHAAAATGAGAGDGAATGGGPPTDAFAFALALAALDAVWDAGDRAAVERRADALLAAAGDRPGADEAAWLRARVIENAGRDAEAATAYAALVERYPVSPRVAEALWRRAWLGMAPESGGGVANGEAEAIAAFDALLRQRPEDARAGDAALLAGVLAWQAGRRDEAVARWASAAEAGERAGRGSDAARAHLWLAKTAVDDATRADHAAAAVALDPLGDAAARVSVDGSAARATSREGEDAATVDWLSRWTAGADADVWSAAREAAAGRRAVVRGAAWLGLGERARALAAWRAGVRESAAPGDRLAVALLARDLGLLSIASSAAEQVLTQAPAAVRAEAPAVVLRLAYPLGWPDLVAASADEHGVPPALLAALVRQESRWDPTAVSSAGARGLTQVMPATGHGIAGALGVAGFGEDRLDDPATALRFGAQYLGVQLERFGGRDAVALAAYNAGPGNAAAWWAAAGGDVDAFMARIAFPETRRYVRGVIAAEGVYRRLEGR